MCCEGFQRTNPHTCAVVTWERVFSKRKSHYGNTRDDTDVRRASTTICTQTHKFRSKDPAPTLHDFIGNTKLHRKVSPLTISSLQTSLTLPYQWWSHFVDTELSSSVNILVVKKFGLFLRLLVVHRYKGIDKIFGIILNRKVSFEKDIKKEVCYYFPLFTKLKESVHQSIENKIFFCYVLRV